MQSKKLSAIEMFISKFTGLIVMTVAQMWYFGTTIDKSIKFAVFAFCTSIVIGYFYRRLFNKFE